MTEDETQDKIAAMRALMAQATAGAVEFARSVSAYYKALIDEGIPPDYALSLTMSWQMSVISTYTGASPDAS